MIGQEVHLDHSYLPFLFGDGTYNDIKVNINIGEIHLICIKMCDATTTWIKVNDLVDVCWVVI